MNVGDWVHQLLCASRTSFL